MTQMLCTKTAKTCVGLHSRRMDIAALADTRVLDAEGREVRTGDLWADRTTVAVWLRHFG